MDEINVEIRSFGEQAAPKVVEDGGRTIEGYAIVFNQRSLVMYDSRQKRYFVETIEPRAVSREFLDSCDIKLNRDHDDGLLLARSRYGSGTLMYEIDEYGVKYRAELPNTTAGNDTLESIRRGDLFGSSFRFSYARDGVRNDRLKDGSGMTLRTVSKFGTIADFSVVTDPAYMGTSVNARSLGIDAEDSGYDGKEEIDGLLAEVDDFLKNTNL